MGIRDFIGAFLNKYRVGEAVKFRGRRGKVTGAPGNLRQMHSKAALNSLHSGVSGTAYDDSRFHNEILDSAQ